MENLRLIIIILIIGIIISCSNTPDGFVLVEGGTFEMGTRNNVNESPVHTVTVNSFYIFEHEVTQKEYIDIMGENPSRFKGMDLPVENVSWYDAVEFCNKLSEKEGLTKCYVIDGEKTECYYNANGYRLPTEAEWDFAFKGGNASEGYTFSGSDILDEVGWFCENSGDKTYPVMSKQPNELGIYDMSGNVYEWCWDKYGKYYYKESPSDNPKGPSRGRSRVMRGGSWKGLGYYCHDFRASDPPYHTSSIMGFRTARTIINE